MNEVELLELEQKPPRWIREEDGAVFYRASSLGYCDRMFVALSQGYSPMSKPQWFQEVLDEGTEAESQIIRLHDLSTGIQTVNQQREVSMEILDNVYVVGHIDGEAENDVNVLREVKKFRDSTYPKFLSKGIEVLPQYPMQVAFYMHAGGYDTCEFIGGHFSKARGEVVEVSHKLLTNPPVPLLAIRKRVAALEALIERSANVMDVGCSKQYPCPVYYLHDDDAEPEVVELERDSTIDLLLTQLAELQDQAVADARAIVKAADTRAKEIKQGIAAWLQSEEVGDNIVAKVGDVEVKYHVQKRAESVTKAYEFTTVSVVDGNTSKSSTGSTRKSKGK